jgi:hypothetical protein
MKNHLNLLRTALSDIDQKQDLSIAMWQRPQIKYPNLCHALEHIVVDQDFRSVEYSDYNEIRGNVIIRVKSILDSLNIRFLEITSKGNPRKGYVPWSCHDCHFHTDFESFVSCPYTCFGEICELLEKIEKDLTES